MVSGPGGGGGGCYTIVEKFEVRKCIIITLFILAKIIFLFNKDVRVKTFIKL